MSNLEKRLTTQENLISSLSEGASVLNEIGTSFIETDNSYIKIRVYSKSQVREILSIKDNKTLDLLVEKFEKETNYKILRNDNNVIQYTDSLISYLADFGRLKRKALVKNKRVFAFISNKGGVGKSTLAAHIAMMLGEANLNNVNGNILVIDLDFQANLTMQVGKKLLEDVRMREMIQKRDRYQSVGTLLMDYMDGKKVTADDICSAMQGTNYSNVFLLPINKYTDSELNTRINSMIYELDRLETSEGSEGIHSIYKKFANYYYAIFNEAIIKPALEEFDYVIVDCPPQMDGLTKMVALSATDIICPMIPTQYEISTTSKMFDDFAALFSTAVNDIENGIFPEKRVKVLINEKQKSKSGSRAVLEEIKKSLQKHCIKTHLNESTAVEKLANIDETCVSANRNYYRDAVGSDSIKDLNAFDNNIRQITKDLLNMNRTTTGTSIVDSLLECGEVLMRISRNVIDKNQKRDNEEYRVYPKTEAKVKLGPKVRNLDKLIKQLVESEKIKLSFNPKNNNVQYDDQLIHDIAEAAGIKELDEDTKRVICVLAQKGGVGKSSVVTNVGMMMGEVELLKKDALTLIIDTDTQANTSMQIGKDIEGRRLRDYIQNHKLYASVYDLMLDYVRGEDIDDDKLWSVIKPTKYMNVLLLPCHPYADAEFDSRLREEVYLAEEQKGVNGFYNICKKYPNYYYMIFYFAVIKPALKHFKNIVIDCPPHMTEMTKMIALASTDIISPLIPSQYEISTASSLLEELISLLNNSEIEISEGVIPDKQFRFLINKQQKSKINSDIYLGQFKKLRKLTLKTVLQNSTAIEKLSSIDETCVTANRAYFTRIVGGANSSTLNSLNSNIREITEEILWYM